MIPKRQFLAITVFALLVVAGVAAIDKPADGFKNLRILPRDIPPQMLDSIMDSYNKALGVNCNFCHAQMVGVPDQLDFASDSNSMKENARSMLRMTIDINKNNFYFNRMVRPEYLNVISCKTCHRGQPFPAE